MSSQKDDEPAVIMMDMADQNPKIPPMGTHQICPNCHGRLDFGFGLAGGGFGPYEYCVECGEMAGKCQESGE